MISNLIFKKAMGKVLLFITSFAMSIVCMAGETVTNNIPTPNAAVLEAAVEIPMTLYHGKADISVPLFSCCQRDIPLDIRLSYDTSGIIVNNLPSWTGHSWTLDAGGVITRIPKGYPDEYDEYKFVSDPYPWTNYFHSYMDIHKDWSNRVGDMQPDIFVFNFMGHTGRFFLGNDGQWKVSGKENISVNFDITDENNFVQPSIKRISVGDNHQNDYKTIKGFTLVDENGTRYNFGYEGNDNAIEYSMSLKYANDGSNAGFWYADSWYLSSVYDRFDNKIYGFNYDRGRFIVNSGAAGRGALPSFSLNLPSYLRTITIRDGTEIELLRDTVNTLTSTDFYHSLYLDYPNIYNYLCSAYNAGRNISQPFVYLVKDCYTEYQNPQNDNKEEDPLRSMELTALREIKIKDRSGGTFKRYTLNYNHTKGIRLHLDNIVIDGGANMSLGVYRFNYYKFGELPADKEGYSDYLTSAVDNWGYYNGCPFMTSEKPSLIRPDGERTKYGMLTSIRYPTGGMDSICYKLNSYEKYRDARNRVVQADKTTGCGGLVVSKIFTYQDWAQDASPAKQRSFFYFDGQLTAIPSFFYGPTVNGRHLTESISSITRKFGFHIGYSRVSEYVVDNLLKEERYNEYIYSNIDCFKNTSCLSDWEILDDIWPGEIADVYYMEALFDEWTDRSYRRGHLLSHSIGTGPDENSVCKRISYEYDYDSVESNYVEGRVNLGDLVSKRYNLGMAAYKLFYGKYGVSQILEEVKDGGQWHSKTTEYDEYNRTVKDSKGNKADIRFRRNERVYDGANTQRTTFHYLFEGHEAAAGFFLPVTSTKYYRNGVFVKGYRDDYRMQNGKLVLSSQKDYFTEDESDAKTVVEYLEYSPTYNLIKSVNKIGQIVQTEYNQFDQVVSNKTGGLTFKYDYDVHGRLKSTESPNGMMTSYCYDTFNRLSKVLLDKDVIKEYKYNYSTSASQSSNER